jgi:L-lactate dehydrogenase complex protein LldG
MSAREEILRRISRALSDGPAEVPVPRGYRSATADHGLERADVIALLAERIADYSATVRLCSAAELAGTVASAVAGRGARQMVVPDGVDPAWVATLPPTVDVIADSPPLSASALDAMDGVLTTCAVAIAETGTVVLDGGPGQGRRALTLVPDYHLVVVPADRVAPSVPAAIAALDPTRPLTWISGPSATSDIELSRVEGVHGPRTLEVIVVEP